MNFDDESIIVGIMKVHPSDQRLFNKNKDIMNDEKQLQDYGITISTARAQSPAELGLALRYAHIVNFHTISIVIQLFCLFFWVWLQAGEW